MPGTENSAYWLHHRFVPEAYLEDGRPTGWCCEVTPGFDEADPQHVAFREWLVRSTGCSVESAVEFMNRVQQAALLNSNAHVAYNALIKAEAEEWARQHPPHWTTVAYRRVRNWVVLRMKNVGIQMFWQWRNIRCVYFNRPF